MQSLGNVFGCRMVIDRIGFRTQEEIETGFHTETEHTFLKKYFYLHERC